MTRILVTSHGRFSLALAVALLDRSAFVEIGTGTITMEVNKPDLDAFNWPNPAVAPPHHPGRRTAQWKSERKGRRS